MPCRWQYSASFFSRRGLVWATNQHNADTGRRIREKFRDVNPKLLVCALRPSPQLLRDKEYLNPLSCFFAPLRESSVVSTNKADWLEAVLGHAQSQ